MSTYLNPQWLKDYYSKWTDDDLHDRHRELSLWGGDRIEKHMIEIESKRRAEEHERNSRTVS